MSTQCTKFFKKCNLPQKLKLKFFSIFRPLGTILGVIDQKRQISNERIVTKEEKDLCEKDWKILEEIHHLNYDTRAGNLMLSIFLAKLKQIGFDWILKKKDICASATKLEMCNFFQAMKANVTIFSKNDNRTLFQTEYDESFFNIYFSAYQVQKRASNRSSFNPNDLIYIFFSLMILSLGPDAKS